MSAASTTCFACNYSKFMMTVAWAAGSFALVGVDVVWKLDKLVDVGDREVAGQPGAGRLDTLQKTRTRALTVAMASLGGALLLARACSMLAPSWNTSKMITVRPNNASISLSQNWLGGTYLS